MRIERLQRAEQRLVDAYQADVISLEELAERRSRIAEQRGALLAQEEQRGRLRRDRQAAQAVLTDVTTFCAQIRRRLETATVAEQQAILQLLIERIVVGEDTLEIHHVIPLRRPVQSQPGPDPPNSELRSCGHIGEAESVA